MPVNGRKSSARTESATLADTVGASYAWQLMRTVERTYLVKALAASGLANYTGGKISTVQSRCDGEDTAAPSSRVEVWIDK